MVVGFGFSFGDFAAAASILFQLIKAFDSIDGAKTNYKSQLAYLRGLSMVCDYIHRNHSNLDDGIIPHANSVWENYIKLHKHLSKYPTLAPKDPNQLEEPAQAKRAFETLRHAFGDIMGKVKRMQDAAMDAVAIIETYVVLEIRDRIRKLEDSNNRQEGGITAASQDLQHIRTLTAYLRQASEDNQETLKKIKDGNDQQNVDAQDIHKKIDDMGKRIEQSQKDLLDSLVLLNQHIKEQRQMASEAAEVQQWKDLQIEIVEEKEELDDLKSSQEQVQNSLLEGENLLKGLGKATENQDLQRLGGRFEGLRQAIGPIGGLFGSKKPKSKAESAPPRQCGPSDRFPNTERRVYKAAPPMPEQSPPRRNDRVWSTACSVPAAHGRDPPEWGRRTIVIHPPPTSNNYKTPARTESTIVSCSLRFGQEQETMAQPPLPPRPSSVSPVGSWLNTLPNVTSRSPPPLPPRRPSDASTVLSSASSSGGAPPSSRSSTGSPPLPSPNLAVATEPAKTISIAELVALIPADRRPAGGVCCGFDMSQLTLAESLISPKLAVSGSSSNSPRLSVSSASSRSLKGPKPTPKPKPNFAARKDSAEVIQSGETSDNTAGISSVRQRAMELDGTLRF